ncbi:MAG: DUF2312 domain-containing protein [Proteobacteria bacterium]|nr:DUF2312 domain-containing protein [Pseudomonadota bacterium]
MSNKDDRLASIVDRITRLHEEKDGLTSDIKDIYAEAKSNGYDVPALRLVVKRQREDADKRAKREEAEAIAAAMESALGAFADSPLGAAAIGKARK